MATCYICKLIGQRLWDTMCVQCTVWCTGYAYGYGAPFLLEGQLGSPDPGCGAADIYQVKIYRGGNISKKGKSKNLFFFLVDSVNRGFLLFFLVKVVFSFFFS